MPALLHWARASEMRRVVGASLHTAEGDTLQLVWRRLGSSAGWWVLVVLGAVLPLRQSVACVKGLCVAACGWHTQSQREAQAGG